MSRLDFHLEAPSPLPVEVYDSELRLVGRTLSSNSVSVEPGTYVVEARLPDGSALQSAVQVGAEASVEVALGSRQEGPVAEAGAGEIGPGRLMIDRVENAYYTRFPGEEEPLRLNLEEIAPRGAWSLGIDAAVLVTFLQDELGSWEPSSLQVVAAGRETRLQPGSQAVGFSSPRGPEVVLIPGGRTNLLRFEIARDEAGETLSLRTRVAHPAADALLGYLGLGQALHARLMAESTSLEAEHLLAGKRTDPLAAAAGAFALLRMNALERLHDWTGNLAGWFPWLPDGTVAFAEHLARTGEHEKAAELLRQLPRQGVPVLSTALDLAVERLRTYSAYWPQDEALHQALVHFSRYAIATDFAAPVTTFLGAVPDSPQPRSNPQHYPKGDI